jgi:TRAP-type C4-dicarboxylate transport system permease small subunit
MTNETTSGARPISALDWIEKICAIGASIGGVLIALMAVQVLVDVLSRALFRQPIQGTYEMVSYWWMPAMAFLAVGLAQVRDQQIRVTIALEHLDPRTLKHSEVAAELICLALAVFMAYLAAKEAFISFSKGETTMFVSWIQIWPGKTAVFVGVVLLALGSFARLIKLFRSSNLAVDELGQISGDLS